MAKKERSGESEREGGRRTADRERPKKKIEEEI